MASLQIMSRTQQARRFYRWRGESSPACVVHAACSGPRGLPLGSATHFLRCHSNATCAPIAYPPNSAQLGASPTILPSYIRVHAIVSAYGRGQTDTQTDTQTHMTTIHFVLSTTHAKCNNKQKSNCLKLDKNIQLRLIPYLMLKSVAAYTNGQAGNTCIINNRSN